MCGVCFVGQVDEKRPEPPVLKAAGEQVEDFQKERVVEVVRDETDELCPPCRQGRRKRVWTVTQFRRGFFNLSAGLERERRALGESTRDCGTRDAGTRRNIFQSNGHGIPLRTEAMPLGLPGEEIFATGCILVQTVLP